MVGFFLWGGFVFSLLWHIPALISSLFVIWEGRAGYESWVVTLTHINCGLSGVSVCAFGYLSWHAPSRLTLCTDDIETPSKLAALLMGFPSESLRTLV